MIFCNEIESEAAVVHLLGATVLELLNNPSVQEVSANYDATLGRCRVFADYGTGPMAPLTATLSPERVTAAMRLLAALNGQGLRPDTPFLNCSLLNGFRLHGVLTQVSGEAKISDGPSFSIRGHARMVRPLADFLSESGEQLVTRAIAERKTLLVVGLTNSGKTTLLNALIGVIPASERLLIIEDTPELQPRPGNVVRRYATPGTDLKRHVIESLRDRPDRIIIGEVRGNEAHDSLEAAATGHPGLSSIHAGSCDQALARLARLAGCDREFVRETIDMVLLVERTTDGRRVVTDIQQLKNPVR